MEASATNEPSSQQESERDEATGNRRERKNVEKQKAAGAVYTYGPAQADSQLRPLPTVTVIIDPTTGMLAKASCPTKTSMTYPAGQEPRQYCSANRQTSTATEAPPDSKNNSRLKSLANRLAAPARWLKNKSQHDDAQANQSSP